MRWKRWMRWGAWSLWTSRIEGKANSSSSHWTIKTKGLGDHKDERETKGWQIFLDQGMVGWCTRPSVLGIIMVYAGRGGWTNYSNKGEAANHLCMPDDANIPQFSAQPTGNLNFDRSAKYINFHANMHYVQASENLYNTGRITRFWNDCSHHTAKLL